jgi:polyhydroxyalkanoate synthase
VLLKPGAFKVLGKPINFKRIKLETFVTGALSDHLTPWKACYRTTQLLGGQSTFILSNAGHIASLINPPGNSKAIYYTGQKPGADPEMWLRGSEKHEGTWWDAWSEWILRRSGSERVAPIQLGNTRYPALTDAPGEYVNTKA